MQDDVDPIPITVLTGFLGSGKTTLLNRLLTDASLADTAVVVNELGEIGLDHLLMASARDTILLLDGGCLCCALTDSLGETLADLYGRRARGQVPRFARVVVETTGMADPVPILRAVLRDPLIHPLFALHQVICTVDAVFGARQFDEHAEALTQAMVADRIVVTKTDLVAREDPQGDPAPDQAMLATRLGEVNPAAQIFDAQAMPGSIARLLDLPPVARGPAIDDRLRLHPLHHAHGVTSLAVHVPRPATRAGVAAWSAALRLMFGADLLRCKALLEIAGDAVPTVLHGVQTIFEAIRLPAWPDAVRGCRIVCIVRGAGHRRIADSLVLLHQPEGSQPPFALADLPFRAEP